MVSFLAGCHAFTLDSVCGHFKSLARYITDARAWSLVRIQVHPSLESIIEAYAVGHVLVLGIAELPLHLLLVVLLHEENQVRVVWFLNNASDVHRVVHLILGLKDFFEAEIIVTLFQSVKRDVLVVLGEHICVRADARALGRTVQIEWSTTCTHRRLR